MSQQSKVINHIKRILKAFYRAICGFKAVFQKDFSFRQEVFFTIVVIPSALFFGATAIEQAILVGSWLLVLIMEIVNSSIELLVDRISLEIHPLSKKIKDMSSTAVLMALINAIVVWVIILTG
jgi:diacylglycerol kinase (ATP)